MSAALSVPVSWPFVTVIVVTRVQYRMRTSELNLPSTVTALNVVIVVEYIEEVLLGSTVLLLLQF